MRRYLPDTDNFFPQSSTASQLQDAHMKFSFSHRKSNQTQLHSPEYKLGILKYLCKCNRERTLSS